jgi:hypothetical protein
MAAVAAEAGAEPARADRGLTSRRSRHARLGLTGVSRGLIACVISRPRVFRPCGMQAFSAAAQGFWLCPSLFA